MNDANGIGIGCQWWLPLQSILFWEKIKSSISQGNIQMLLNLELVVLEVKCFLFPKNSWVSYSFICCSFGLDRGN